MKEWKTEKTKGGKLKVRKIGERNEEWKYKGRYGRLKDWRKEWTNPLTIEGKTRRKKTKRNIERKKTKERRKK